MKEHLAEAESVLLERALPVTYPPEKAAQRLAAGVAASEE